MQDFERIYSAYYDMVFGYCLHLSHDPSLAEEIAQESFFKALKAIDSFHGECRLEVWLCQIAKNTDFSLLKKQKRTAPPLSEDWPDPGEFRTAVGRPGGSPAHPPGASHAAGTLPGSILAQNLWGTQLRQIAGLFDKTESWARVTYHRARTKIKEELA